MNNQTDGRFADGYTQTEPYLEFDPAEWRTHAACAGAQQDHWFPERGTNATEAKRICNLCPVRQPCLDYAQDNCIQHGIFGGLTPNERKITRNPVIRVRVGEPHLRLVEQ